MSGSPQPPNALLLSLLNRALESLNRSETAQAERFLLQALSIAPRDPNALQLMGVTRRAQNRIEDAEAFYLQSLASSPTNPRSITTWATCIALKGNTRLRPTPRDKRSG